MTFYINYFQDFMIDLFYDIAKFKADKSHKPSFKQTNALHILTSFNQFEWRIPFFWLNMIESFVDHMGHSNKLIRELMPPCLMLTVSNDMDYSFKLPYNPNELEINSLYKYKMDNLNQLVTKLEMKLSAAIELHDKMNDESLENKKEIQRDNIDVMIYSMNLVQSTLNWIVAYISRSLQPLNFVILRLIPLVCLYKKLTV